MAQDDEVERAELLEQLRRMQADMDSTIAPVALEPFLSIRLTMQQVKVLFVLAAESEGGTVQRLAKTLGVSLATMSGIVDRLEAHGVITRETDPSDHRVRRVLVTASGRSLVQELLSARQRLTGQVLERLAVPDLRALAQGVGAILEVMRSGESVDAEAGPPVG